MKGFFKKDLYLILGGAKFYLFCILICMLPLGGIYAAGKTGMGFLGLYVMLFVASTLLTLFNYDEQSGWGAYAAAVPGGRRAQVDARYLVALAMTLVVMALQGVMCLFSVVAAHGEEGQWAILPLYAGMMLIYIALLFPLTYRFGNKSRLIMIVLIVLIGSGFGASNVIAFTAGVKEPSFAAVGAVLLAIGAVAVAVSHRVSVAIVRRQEW